MTTHNSLMKPDGTGSADVRSMIFSNGEAIMVMGKANGKMVDPAPIEKIEEDLTFMTASKNFAYLNTTKGKGRRKLQHGNRRIHPQGLCRQIARHIHS